MKPKAETFAVGALVSLKSGGPTMTVTELLPMPDRVRCAWFGGKRACSEVFAAEALEKADRPAPRRRAEPGAS